MSANAQQYEDVAANTITLGDHFYKADILFPQGGAKEISVKIHDAVNLPHPTFKFDALNGKVLIDFQTAGVDDALELLSNISSTDAPIPNVAPLDADHQLNGDELGPVYVLIPAHEGNISHDFGLANVEPAEHLHLPVEAPNLLVQAWLHDAHGVPVGASLSSDASGQSSSITSSIHLSSFEPSLTSSDNSSHSGTVTTAELRDLMDEPDVAMTDRLVVFVRTNEQ